MKRIVTFSTGNNYGNRESINKDIEISLKVGADGLEIVFPTVQHLMNFKITPKNKKGLLKLKFNTVHIPFDDKDKTFYIYNNLRCKKIIKKVCDFAKSIDAININFHPDQIKNHKIFENFKDMKSSIENVVEDKDHSIEYYKKIFKKCPNFYFLLDTSHAIRTKQMKPLINNFKDKINFIHLSGTKGLRDDHYLVHRLKHKNRKQLDLIKKLKCQVIIEAGREEGITLKDFKKEVKYVRKWLNK